MTDTVLGISVVDDQIASVVRDGDGRVVASNLVDLPDSATSSQVESAIEELVTSVPMDFQHIGLAVADDSLREHLNSAFAPTAGTPDWHSKIGVTDFPTALAEVARAQATRPGVVAVVDLGTNAAPSVGATTVTVDVATGRLVGVGQFDRGECGPVTEHEGASALADAITEMPGGDKLTSVICTGPGAETPGVAPAFEYAVQRPVTIADQPSLASAISSAELARVAEAPTMLTRSAPASSGKRWWFIGAAIGAAIVLGALAITAVLAADGELRETSPSTITSTVTTPGPGRTVTKTEAADTVVETETRTVTQTTTPRPVTRTRTITETPPAETTTETETVTETVNPNPYDPNAQN
ncbi:hypothetical protein [Gordonia sp. NPDC003585]|uniref:hypothetical protein n=1 Tax=Gordonia sp. NPDC003585 TaxID=3154275 RepID=UPI0033B6B78D